jgi:non-heme chloroperoxidase
MPKISVAKIVDIHAQDWGAGKTIVFIHGWPMGHRIFEYQMMALAKKDCRVIGIDLRGFGQSDKPWEGNDYDTWAADVGKVISELALRDVTLAGFSIGAAVAAHYAAKRIDTRISKLALISAPLLSPSPGPEDKQALEEKIQALIVDRPKFMLDYAKSMLHTAISPEHLQWYASLGMQSSLRACMRSLEELHYRNLKPEIGNIRIPTRFFHGAMDQVVPISLAESQVGLIKGATLVRFENSGQALFYDEKDKLVEELEKFAGESAAKASAA